jgi:hypothetical protein
VGLKFVEVQIVVVELGQMGNAAYGQFLLVLL